MCQEPEEQTPVMISPVETVSECGMTVARSSPPVARTRRAAVEATALNSGLTKRLKALAVAVVMERPIDQNEKSALREIIEKRISEAQAQAAREAIASL
jgi:hypothetical protein